MPSSHNQKPNSTQPPLRWCYLALSLSLILWFGAEIIDQRINLLQTIELIEEDTQPTQGDEPAFTPLQLCRFGSLLLAITSISLISYQLFKQNRQGAKRSTDHEPPSRV